MEIQTLINQLTGVQAIFKGEYETLEDIHAALAQLSSLAGMVKEKIFTDKRIMEGNSKGYPKVLDKSQISELAHLFDVAESRLSAAEGHAEKWLRAAGRRSAAPERGRP
jgi:hypothetical protein